MKLAFLDSLRRTGRRLRPLMVVAVAAMAVTLTGCVFDDELDSAVCNTLVGPDEYALNLTINLGSLPVTRVSLGSNTQTGNEWENKIKTFRLLFFTNENNGKDGKFLFEADFKTEGDPNVKRLETSIYDNYGESYVYSVLLRIKDYTSKNEEAIMQALQYDGFKIAVLANWPDADREFKFGDSIHKLHHYSEDTVYASRQDVFKPFIVQEGGATYMGTFQNWVYSHFSSEAAAGKYLRDELNPLDKFYTVKWPLTQDPRFVQRTYNYDTKSLLRIWNFGGGLKAYGGNNTNAALSYHETEEQSKRWYERNGEEMKNAWTSLSGRRTPSATSDGLTFPSASYSQAISTADGNGILLDPVKTSSPANYEGTITDGHYFQFYAKATGYVRIKAAKQGTGTAFIYFENNNDASKRFGMEVKATAGNGVDTNLIGMSYDNPTFMPSAQERQTSNGKYSETDSKARISVDYESTPVKVYCQSSNSSTKVIIYEIEFMEQKYLYDSNRDALYPSEDDLIPMYGVQNFIGIGEYWEQGKVFDLFNGNLMSPDGWAVDNELTYNGKKEYIKEATGRDWDDWNEGKNGVTQLERSKTTIHLLRSVARVDLYIPRSFDGEFGNPDYVYMRCLNRSGRCEPMDVSTPTNELWEKRATDWTNVCNYGPFYMAKSTSAYPEYHNRLSWFYYSWNDWNWNWNNQSKPVPFKHNSVSSTTLSNTYPRILNPRVERSDFCRFVELNESGDNRHFVFYLPEKFIDDPNSHGKLDDGTPKVAHIEIRFDKKNWDNDDDTSDESGHHNLDDANCYNIYFTEYTNNWPAKVAPNKGYNANTWSNFEKNADNLAKLWPIMRNHIYTFNVTSLTRSEGISVISSGPKDTFGIVDVDE